jgi:hypothetical protein
LIGSRRIHVSRGPARLGCRRGWRGPRLRNRPARRPRAGSPISHQCCQPRFFARPTAGVFVEGEVGHFTSGTRAFIHDRRARDRRSGICRRGRAA